MLVGVDHPGTFEGQGPLGQWGINASLAPGALSRWLTLTRENPNLPNDTLERYWARTEVRMAQMLYEIGDTNPPGVARWVRKGATLELLKGLHISNPGTVHYLWGLVDTCTSCGSLVYKQEYVKPFPKDGKLWLEWSCTSCSSKNRSLRIKRN